MNLKSNVQYKEVLSYDEDQLLGKRYEFVQSEQKSFEVKAMSIGFSSEELERLTSIYRDLI